MSRKHNTILIILILTVNAAAIGALLGLHTPKNILDADSAARFVRSGTNINEIYSEEELLSQLREQYPKLYNALDMDGSPVYIVPGMITTATIETSTGRPGISRHMTPQGIALTDDYLIISAYSYDNAYYSVLYVMDRESGDYVKTIVLPGTPHAGGLAYDECFGRLWIAETTDGKRGMLAAIDDKTLRQEDFSRSAAPVTYDYLVRVDSLENISFLTWHGGSLYMGSFSRNGAGKLEAYDLDDRGLPESGDAFTGARGAVAVINKIQGVACTEDSMFFSKSWGPSDSTLLMHRLDDGDIFDDFKSAAFRKLHFPPYMEQIVASGDDLYVLFESEAAGYRGRENILHVDRVFRFRISKLFS